MFLIVNTKIESLIEKYSQPKKNCGGRVIFQGIVRNINESKEVVSLRYEAYESLAVKEGDKIITEAINSFKIVEAFSLHREGVLFPGDLAVWILVNSIHREEAFKACKYIIDNVKFRVPIWKEEKYTDGSSTWVYCHEDHHHIN